MTKKRWLALCGVGLFALAPHARANDSSAELAVGGIVLRQSTNITMKSEDLYISRENIRVRYVYRNTSRAPVRTIVAFPLPDVIYRQEEEQYKQTADAQAQGDVIVPFETKIDGARAPFNTELRAFKGGREITQRLKGFQLPLLISTPALRTQFQTGVAGLSAANRNALIREGLISETGFREEPFTPLWRTTINIWRHQTFPAGRDVVVEHSYKPFVGGSVDTSLRREYRAANIAQYRRDYCVDEGFLTALDRRLAGRSNSLMPMESWVQYILKSGANWSGPIGRFTLTIDKGEPNYLVSFCENGVRRISPTQFQVTRTNFTPTRDLNILFMTFTNLDD